MEMTELEKEYYNWLIQLVCPVKAKRQKYSKVLQVLYNREFYYYIPMDANREGRAIDFRYRFGCDMGYPNRVIADEIDIRPATVLEVMVETAVTMEETIMQDDDYGNRTDIWFWDMMTSLKLDMMTNDIFNEAMANDIITRLLERDYEENGEGGLFTVRRPFSDMRDVPIWAQANWYINEYRE